MVGGRNKNEIVCGILQKVFDNKLAVRCSWKGQKQNFPIGRSFTISCIRGKIRKKCFGYLLFFMFLLFRFLECVCDAEKNVCTEAEFKTFSMNWFRFARQRLEREEKQNIKM